jgi:hypothetical protein
MPASHFDVSAMTGRPKFIVRHSMYVCRAVEAGKSDVNSYVSNYKMLALASVMNWTS